MGSNPESMKSHLTLKSHKKHRQKPHGHTHGGHAQKVGGHGHNHGKHDEDSQEVPFCWSSFVDNLEPNKRKSDSLFHTKQAQSIIKTMDKLQNAKTVLLKTDKEYKIKTRFIQRLVDQNNLNQRERDKYFKRTLSVSPHRSSKRNCKSGGAVGSVTAHNRSPQNT